MKYKFQLGDIVGWKSDSSFTATNKNIPAEKVIARRISKETKRPEYKITRYSVVGWIDEWQLETRTTNKLTALLSSPSISRFLASA